MKTKKWNKTAGIEIMIPVVLIFICSIGLMYQIYMEKNFRLYDETLRFHVRAVSDEPEEQALKRKVRNSVLAFLKEETDAAVSASQLEKSLKQETEQIKEAALKTIEKLGYEKEVKVTVTKERFPIRRYGTVIFPAGEYHALRVDIGAAEGHNWWCAIYPELCYNTEEEFELSGKGKKDLESALSEEEQKDLAGKRIKLRFKLLEWISGLQL